MLRYRDPVYRSLRELALSYFHEYCDRKGRHTLRSYSRAFDLRRVDTDLWVTPEKACWDVHERLVGLRHYPLVTAPAGGRAVAAGSPSRAASRGSSSTRSPANADAGAAV